MRLRRRWRNVPTEFAVLFLADSVDRLLRGAFVRGEIALKGSRLFTHLFRSSQLISGLSASSTLLNSNAQRKAARDTRDSFLFRAWPKKIVQHKGRDS